MDPRDYSLLRRAQYKELFSLEFSGKVLDLGGDTRNNYHPDLQGEHSMDIANLNPDSGANMIFDFEKRFPIEDGMYDTILCLNVLEHVFEFDALLSEAFRVLKPGGNIIISTPFMFRVHGAPDDFFRYTESALVKILEKHNVSDMDMRVLRGGMFTVMAQHISGMVPTIFLRNIFRSVMMGLDSMFRHLISRYSLFEEQTTLGYFVIATKK